MKSTTLMYNLYKGKGDKIYNKMVYNLYNGKRVANNRRMMYNLYNEKGDETTEGCTISTNKIWTRTTMGLQYVQ